MRKRPEVSEKREHQATIDSIDSKAKSPLPSSLSSSPKSPICSCNYPLVNAAVSTTLPVKTNDYLERLIDRVARAQQKYAHFSQEQVDEIFLHAAMAANKARITLAREAFNETKMGILEDKVIKNHFASEFIFNQYCDAKTCGVIYSDADSGMRRIADPVGVVAGVTPVTNPTSTVIFKALLALKTRNGIVFCPHPTAKRCSVHAAQIILEAAIKAGAPEGIIGCIEEPTIELSTRLMQHPKIAMIFATGGPNMVRAAYSSGKPAIGVGAGNTPAVIDETADIPLAVSSILISKTFDNGVICASEQSIVVVDDVYDKVKKEFLRQGAYILSNEEREKLAKTLIIDGKLNAKIVGRSAATIAQLAGFTVPSSAKVLIGEVEQIGLVEPFSYEKLSPILGLYHASTFTQAVAKAAALVEFGGMGHTAALYTHEHNNEHMMEYGEKMKTSRILINTPSSHGAIGGIYNPKLEPSLTLGCGPYGGNITSENIGPKHLLNIKALVERRESALCLRVPSKIYFKSGCLAEAMHELSSHARAFIVTNRYLFDLHYVDKITKHLREYGIQYEIFSDAEMIPSFSLVKQAVKCLEKFKPDVIIAMGDGSTIDAAKVMGLLYENPEVNFEEMSMRFIKKRIYQVPKLGKKAVFVAIPTTSGRGSEVTPFAAVIDDKTGAKYPLTDYSLTPQIAVIDPQLVMELPKTLTAASGFDAIAHAIEAYVAITDTPYGNAMAIEALLLLFRYLPIAYHEGGKNPHAREQVHYAATMAGVAFANNFLGICHSLTHELCATFHVPHGVACALLLPAVINFNATDAPRKQGLHVQYSVPEAIKRYGEISDALHLGGRTPMSKVNRLILAIEHLRRELDIPATIKELDIEKEEFYSRLEQMAESAFDDQCTATNPRHPSIEELKEIYATVYDRGSFGDHDLEFIGEHENGAAK